MPTQWTNELINQHMSTACPELESKYAQFPILRSRWMSPNETFNGQPMHIATANQGFREHYVFCKVGPKGPGYYHLLTKTSYVGLSSRLNSSSPGGLRLRSENRAKAKAWGTARLICFNRYQSGTRPNDHRIGEQAFGKEIARQFCPIHELKPKENSEFEPVVHHYTQLV